MIRINSSKNSGQMPYYIFMILWAYPQDILFLVEVILRNPFQEFCP